MTVRVGILGAGNISETHARAAQQIPHVEIVAVHGRNARKVARLAETYGATAYDDLDGFLDHGLDVVLIGSPSGVHAEQAGAAVRRGIHALVEKPLDISTERIDVLIAEAERNRVKLGVFFQDRAAPDIQWLRRLVVSDGLGRIILASARVRWFRPPEYYAGSRWRGTWALDGGGAVMNQGSHTIDLLLWLLGDPARVYARTRAALHAVEVEDTAIACFEFADGAFATFEATTAAYPGYPRRLDLTGSNGTVVLEADRVTSVDLIGPPAEPLARGEGLANQSASSAIIGDARGHRAVLEDFLRAIETGSRPLCDGHEARRSVAVVEAIYRSARTGEAVELSPVGSSRAELSSIRRT